MDDCIFCSIIRGESPAEIIFENETTVAILDRSPIHFGHTLIIPKIHCRDFLELPVDHFQGLLETAQRVAKAVVAAYSLEGFNLFSNNGEAAGQSVFHFHLHVTPRQRNDKIRFVLELKRYRDGEMAAVAQSVRACLAQHTPTTGSQ